MSSQNIRAKTFWALDSLKGKKIKNHFDDIRFINETNDSSLKIEKRKNHIINILNHTVTTTPFYKGYSNFKTLQDFPVIKKSIIQENFEQFKSQSYLKKPMHKVATSGSTGVPFFLFQDDNKKNRNTADTLYYLNKANYTFGEKLYDIEVWRGINMNSSLKSWMRNLIYIDVSRFNDFDIETFLRKLEDDTSHKNLIGFASAFESICMYLDKIESGILTNIKINSVISISEYLSSYVKASMEKYFNTTVVSRYSNEELGIIAQQLPNKNEEFHINWASYHIEILKMDSDSPTEKGEMGRIVVTDLFNYCMPIIRYDTGDISTFTESPTSSNPYPTLERIEGRKMDVIYDTKGEHISPFVIYTKFYNYYHLLKQYQFIQESKRNYTVKLNTHTGDFKYNHNLIKDIQNDFGKDANIKIVIVNEIPPLSSGKRKKVINNYTKNN